MDDMDLGKSEDRISDLPDSLLHHILSFLQTKVVARTSVLSHRWKDIWTSIPNLEFVCGGWRSAPTCSSKFMNFVDGTLLRHSFSSSLREFHLRSYVHLDKYRVSSWISNVVTRHNVEKLSLFLHQDDPFDVPLSVFTCESLISLTLRTHPTIRFPKYFKFPRLKRLRLDNFEFTNDCWNEELFSYCPVLEEMLLDCSFRMPYFCICVPSLKCLIFSARGCLRDCALSIHAPGLVTLQYTGEVAKEYILSSFPTLEEASVFFDSENGNYAAREQRTVGHEEAISQFFGALAHVKRLTVDVTKLQVICCAEELFNHLPTFHNIKYLDVDLPVDDKPLLPLLKVTPNLESLVFETIILDDTERDTADEGEENRESEDEGAVVDAAEEDGDESENSYGSGDEGDDANTSVVGGSDEREDSHDSEDEGDDANTSESEGSHGSKNDGWRPSLVDTGGLFLHLKSARFLQFQGNLKEMWWVKEILRNAKALQSMTIYSAFPISAKVPYGRLMEIPRFPSAAESCVFKFCFRVNQKWENHEIHCSKDS